LAFIASDRGIMAARKSNGDQNTLAEDKKNIKADW
jgi:hypothetical protein